jgi:hypothetical protein
LIKLVNIQKANCRHKFESEDASGASMKWKYVQSLVDIYTMRLNKFELKVLKARRVAFAEPSMLDDLSINGYWS